MSVRHSDSLHLVWRVAASEAKHLGYSEIEPRHFFLGLCKVIDLDISEIVDKSVPNRNEVLEECLREVRRVREVFRLSEVDPKRLRRQLRAAYGTDSLGAIEPGPLRRSAAARKMFTAAERLAGLTNLAVLPLHLLDALLSEEDAKRDSIIAGLGGDTSLLRVNTKEEVFRPANADVTDATKRIRLN